LIGSCRVMPGFSFPYFYFNPARFQPLVDPPGWVSKLCFILLCAHSNAYNQSFSLVDHDPSRLVDFIFNIPSWSRLSIQMIPLYLINFNSFPLFIINNHYSSIFDTWIFIFYVNNISYISLFIKQSGIFSRHISTWNWSINQINQI